MPTDPPITPSPTVFVRGTCPHGHTHTHRALRQDHDLPAAQDPDGNTSLRVAGYQLTCSSHAEGSVSWWVAAADLPAASPDGHGDNGRSAAAARYQAARDQLRNALPAEVSQRVVTRFPTAGLLVATWAAADGSGPRLLRVRKLVDVQGYVLAPGEDPAVLETLVGQIDVLLGQFAALDPSGKGEVHVQIGGPPRPSFHRRTRPAGDHDQPYATQPETAEGADMSAASRPSADAGVSTKPANTGEEMPRVLEGKAIVLTGGLESFTRNEAVRAIEKRGGRVTSSVSKRTDYVVVGADAGSKADRAVELGIPTLDEAAFRRLLDTGEVGKPDEARASGETDLQPNEATPVPTATGDRPAG